MKQTKKNKALRRSIIVLCSFFLSPLTSLAQAGSLDLSFDTDGIVTTAVGVSNDFGFPVVIQSDGKIVQGGASNNGTSNDFTLLRYNTDGSLDITFDTDGIVTTSLGTGGDLVYALAIQSDGKIIAAGYSTSPNYTDFALVRYHTNGSIDSSFHFDGKVKTSVGDVDEGRSLAIQSDGKIILAGVSHIGANKDFCLLRYNTNGNLDSTFDSDGIVTTTFGAGHEIAYSVAIQTDGKIVVAGSAVNAPNTLFAVARYNIDGSLDNTFDTDGKVTTNAGLYQDAAHSVVIQSDDKIVVAGGSANGANDDIVLARYNTDGSLDNTFDMDGLVTTSIGPDEEQGWAVALQTDGKIVVVGQHTNNATSDDFAVVRYNTNGSLDNTFDNDGIVTTPLQYENYGYGVAIQNDGKIVLSGISWILNNDQDFAIARYNNSGAVDIFKTNKQITELKVYPNPFSASTSLHTSNTFSGVNLTVYNIFGQAVKQISNIEIGAGHSITLHRDNLPGGFYFVQLTQDSKVISGNKLVIVD